MRALSPCQLGTQPIQSPDRSKRHSRESRQQWLNRPPSEGGVTLAVSAVEKLGSREQRYCDLHILKPYVKNKLKAECVYLKEGR